MLGQPRPRARARTDGGPRRQGLRHPRRPRRRSARSRHGRRGAADLAGHHLRAGGRRQAAGLRVQPQRQPHPRRARDPPRRAGGRVPRVRVRVGPGRRGRPAPPGRRRATTCCSPTTPTAAPSAWPSRSTPRPACVVDTVDLTDLDAVAAAWQPGTRMVWVETPSNPWLRIVDIEAISALAHERGARRGRRQHLRHAGAAATRSRSAPTSSCTPPPSTSAATATWSAASSPPATTSWPSASGSSRTPPAPCPARSTATSCTAARRTLPLRMERHSENAAAVADLLAAHPAVARVLYPGLPDHPGHAIAARQMSAFGGMVSMRLAGGEAAALEVCRRTEVFTLAESLGAVESLIEHPGRMTHASVAGTANEVPADLVRLSVGIEDVDDLLADLTQALGSTTQPRSVDADVRRTVVPPQNVDRCDQEGEVQPRPHDGRAALTGDPVSPLEEFRARGGGEGVSRAAGGAGGRGHGRRRDHGQRAPGAGRRRLPHRAEVDGLSARRARAGASRCATRRKASRGRSRTGPCWPRPLSGARRVGGAVPSRSAEAVGRCDDGQDEREGRAGTVTREAERLSTAIAEIAGPGAVRRPDHHAGAGAGRVPVRGGEGAARGDRGARPAPPACCRLRARPVRDTT